LIVVVAARVDKRGFFSSIALKEKSEERKWMSDLKDDASQLVCDSISLDSDAYVLMPDALEGGKQQNIVWRPTHATQMTKSFAFPSVISFIYLRSPVLFTH
jgi:hypothetical protein